MITIKFDWDNGRRQAIVSGDFFDEIRERFSVKNEAAKFARMRGRWSSARTYSITPAGRFDIGLYDEINKFISESQIDANVVCTEDFHRHVRPSFNVSSISKLKLKLRSYQDKIVNNCITNGRGTVILATAGGKTLTIATLLDTLYKADNNFKCALIVPDLGLVNQTSDDFTDYGVNFQYSKWTGNHELNLGSNVIICNLGILQSSKSNVDWLRDIDVCVIDEVHKLRRGNKINKILKTVRTPHKFGLTGTMPEELIDQWNIIGKIGTVIYEKNSAALRKDNYISDVKVQILQLDYIGKPKYPASITNPSDRYRVELDFLANNEFRNKLLSSLARKFDKNSLILVDYIDHGTTLHRYIQESCPDKKVYFIRGEVAVEDRDRIKKLMEEEDDIRLHKNKTELIIFDIGDMLQYGTQHLLKRIALYEQEGINYGVKKISEKTN